MGVEPAKIAPGDTVTVSVDVRSVGAATIADGVVAVVATAPDGRTFTQSSKSVAVAAGKTVKVDQQRGPYTVVGTWVFRASFTDAAGTVLAKGPAAGASMDVTAPTGPVKVLLYSGSDTATDDVAGTVDALSQASAGNWIPGTTFTVTKTTVVDASSLAGQDVVIVPGGDSGRAYLADSNLDGAALRAFVTGGKGYFGTCAGA
jgi:putative intracellular protease/amidase